MMDLPRCNICNSTEIKLKFIKSGFKFMYCKKCYFLFVHPIPSIEIQKNWYEQSYRNGQYKQHSGAENLRIKLNQKRFEEILKYHPNGNILDVGCATGFFLNAAAEQGLSTYGVEFSLEAVKKANTRHKIFNGTLENAKYPDSFFDVITMYDFIEHVMDPNYTIKEISRIIKPGGLLIMTTPDISSWHAKLMGKHWGVITAPEHLYYFSPRSTRFLLENNSFKILEIKKDHKIFNLSDMFKIAEFYYPRIFKIYTLFKSLFPKEFLHKDRILYFGDLFAVAKKL